MVRICVVVFEISWRFDLRNVGGRVLNERLLRISHYLHVIASE